MRPKKYDFCGWATKNDMKCSDGRTIKHNAFIDCDGKTVPLVWNHQHGEPENVLGHALLENRDEGVYAYCSFNESPEGETAKYRVVHGDINQLSIYANKLKQVGNDVIHGVICEVSLVLAGANPGAYIEEVLAHGDDESEAGVIYTGEEIELYHSCKADDEDDKKKELEHSKEDASEEPEKKEDDKDMESKSEKTVGEIMNSLTEEQAKVVYAMIGAAAKKGAAEPSNETEGDDETMKHNAFDNENQNNDVIMHDAMNNILADGKRYGSLKESFLAHADEYGIQNIEYLQPDDKNIYDRPQFINNQPIGWVSVVMNGVHNTPFAKIKMIFADITEDEARAKGYTKGKLKKEEVFKLLKRSVSPTTIYKKQKFDRDDLIDADFDVIPWIKQEMNLKLDEEKARAYLFGDGRSAADDDKVDENCIIPIVNDADLYSIKVTVTQESGESLEHALITACVTAQDDYQGSGNTTAFIEAKQVSKMLLMEDQFGHRLYKDVKELAAAMGVGQVCKVPAGVVPSGIYGVIVDLNDYNVGMKAAGQKNFFDDFDIDYNQQKYLLETRQSGALIRPYSAIVLKEATS